MAQWDMAGEAPWSNLRATIYSILYRNPRSNRRIAGFVPMGSDDRVLDVGCGPGSAVRAASPLVASAAGVDASPKMIEIANERSAGFDNVEFKVGAAENLPFPDRAFSIVWTIQSWHHWNDPAAGLKEAARVLMPGGHFYIVEKRTSGQHGLNDARAHQLVQELEDAGFTGAFLTSVRKDLVVSGALPRQS